MWYSRKQNSYIKVGPSDNCHIILMLVQKVQSDDILFKSIIYMMILNSKMAWTYSQKIQLMWYSPRQNSYVKVGPSDNCHIILMPVQRVQSDDIL